MSMSAVASIMLSLCTLSRRFLSSTGSLSATRTSSPPSPPRRAASRSARARHRVVAPRVLGVAQSLVQTQGRGRRGGFERAPRAQHRFVARLSHGLRVGKLAGSATRMHLALPGRWSLVAPREVSSLLCHEMCSRCTVTASTGLQLVCDRDVREHLCES